MTRTIATLIASTALVACSSEPPAMASASNVNVAQSYAETTSYPQAFTEDLAVQIQDEVDSKLDNAPLAAQAYDAPAPAPYSAPRVEQVRASTCEIIVKRTPNGVLLKAVANLSRPTAGDYSFTITKSGGGGSSDINQGGELESYAGRHELGSSEVSMGRGASYRATLKLISPSGREICRRVVRS